VGKLTGCQVAGVARGVFVIADTCNVYVLRAGRRAICVDFGSGLVLERLDRLGVAEVTDVLMTHHHRDQAQGLGRASELGVRIWVPPIERGLFESVDEHWQSRGLDNDYELLQDRFSILESVEIAGVSEEYVTRRYSGWEVTAVPTPGHTVGSVTYIADVDGSRLAFVGDLLYSDSKVWSLAAMQWTYNGLEGAAMTIASLRSLRELAPDVLLPSHGAPIEDPERAIDEVGARLQALLDHRPTSKVHHVEARELAAWTEHPFVRVSEHLLMNRTSRATSYCVVSDDSVALLIDYGYDMTSSELAPSTDRYARRPWLASLPALCRDFGISRVEVVMPTHYHDDHVAGINLLRQIAGTQVWAAENIAPVLNDPRRFDLPCLWYEPIRVDRVLRLGDPVRWREYEFASFELSGHTRYAVAIAFEVDGQRVIATGDQQDGHWSPLGQQELLHYQYRNGFRIDDYVDSARLYRHLSPDLIISGHWEPRRVTTEYLDALLEEGEHVARLHRQLLPLEEVNFEPGGFGARIEPYRCEVLANQSVSLAATVRNPFARAAKIIASLVVPRGWGCEPRDRCAFVESYGTTTFEFLVHPKGPPVRRARVAIDMAVDSVLFGQQAEALVNVVGT
jgi:glyoxylase-like metal-dependent hydrolase (beta-lactamase superfamily II)